MARITIVGLGLIGGSLGLALRRGQVEHELVGYDADAQAARAAQRRGAVDRAVGDLGAAIDGARLVVLATPVLAVRELLAALGPLLAPGCVVTDTASTKTAVLRWAAELLPDVAFVGGHPMAGKETSGVAAAEETLFDG
ncbi:MAG: prephenate dehydrogenase/arogenate dehydrogenase family protein, partial [Chloroflexi bacterium]|nr:prephenate dehydrogenase/arogenate dehydrogenase family protein [Chloroflexota bacterium]